MNTIKDAMSKAGQTAQKSYLIENGGIESVWQGQKRITMPDGTMWFQVAGNTYECGH